MAQQKITSIKIQSAQSQIESVGYRWKHLSVALHGNQSISAVLEDPTCWSSVQADKVRCLNKGDKVSIISSDGLTLADQVVVVKALAGSVWLGKPLRLIQMESVGLFEGDAYRVVPAGTGFAIQGTRDSRTDDRVFATAKAAESEIHRRAPVKAA